MPGNVSLSRRLINSSYTIELGVAKSLATAINLACKAQRIFSGAFANH